MNVTILCGSYRRPSRTLALCHAVIDELKRLLPAIRVHVVEISQIGRELGACLQRGELPPEIETHLQAVEKADLLIAASPVYRATYSGLFKHFADFLDINAMTGKPVLLAACGGSPLHTLVIDHQLRPLFAMLQTLTMPVGVYATEADIGADGQIHSPAIQKRIEMVVQLALPHLPE